MNNNLTKYKFKTIYSNNEEVTEFYSNALRFAKLYKRVSAYFSNGIFKYLKKGLHEFINNDGYIQLILSMDLDKEVFEEINKGYLLKEEKVFQLMNKKSILEELSKICEESEISLFSYLIAIGKMDVKIGYKEKGIVHSKFGCISDGINNLVYIGSNNFTGNAVDNNDETFQVTIDWDSPSKRELSTVNELNVLFDKYWNNAKDDVITIDLPDPILTEMFDKIDYNSLKKYKDNLDYIRFDIKNKQIIITSNKNLIEIMTYKNIGSYSSFVKFESNSATFDNILSSEEMLRLYNLMKKVCRNLNINYYKTLAASKYFELHTRDYEELYIKGQCIKTDGYLKSEEFKNYKEHINKVVKRSLVDQQVVGASHIIEMQKSLNFSVPGSGKTATVIGAFEYLSSLPITDKRYVDKLLVIGPINCAKSWRDEYKLVSKYSKEHSALNIIGAGSKSDKIDVLLHDYPTSRLIIINYELIPTIKNELIKLVNDRTFIVFDEIHRIKNTSSMKYEALKEIVFNAKYRVALTGTPLPNGYIDLYNIISLLHDDYTQNYFQMFHSNLKSDDSIFKKTGVQNLELNKLLYPFYIRVTKDDLNIPRPNDDNLILVPTNNKEKDVLSYVLKNYDGSFDRMIKLEQIGCVPFKCYEVSGTKDYFSIKNEIKIEDYMTSKLHKFLNIVLKNNRKCVVWCQFVDTIHIVTKLLIANNIKAKAIYGATEQDDRDKIIEDFNFTNNVDVIVTNPATLAESVSLHKACHDAHYLELNYNLYQYLQSRDRIHRLGLKPDDKTNYYIYINMYYDDLNKNIDMKIYNALGIKEDRMKTSIERGNFLFGSDSDIDVSI